MPHPATESRFLAAEESGEVSALTVRPASARWMLVLGHGAGAGMRHAHLEHIAQHLADRDVATFRYQFPYVERGGWGMDSREVVLATVRAAASAGHDAAPDLPLLLGGHSFGGRMASNAVAERAIEHVRGLVFFSFPLHPPGRMGTSRAEHLKSVELPMLFLSGTRDTLAERDLLQGVCEGLGDRVTLHFLDTADHGFKILKRTRTSTESVYEEAARVLSEWAEKRQLQI